MNPCPRCSNPIDETDNFCRHCGRSLKPGTGFLFSHPGIILMAFVLGPFALPFVWLSKTIGGPADAGRRILIFSPRYSHIFVQYRVPC